MGAFKFRGAYNFLSTLSPEERDFVSQLRERFGTQAAIVRDRRGGRIELRFRDDEELLRLGDLLLGDQ